MRSLQIPPMASEADLIVGSLPLGGRAVKRRRTLPETFLVVRKTPDRETAFAVGLVTVADIKVYTGGGCSEDAMNKQYLALVAQSGESDVSKYVNWSIERWNPFIDRIDLQGKRLRLQGSMIGHKLEAEELARLGRQAKLRVANETFDLQTLGPVNYRTLVLPPAIVDVYLQDSFDVLVTPRGYAYHSGYVHLLNEEVSRDSQVHLLQDAVPSVDVSVAAESCADDDAELHSEVHDRYSFQQMIAALKLSDLLKSADKMTDAVKASIELVLPDKSADICAKIDSGEIRVPQKDAVLRGWQKLDCAGVLWERETIGNQRCRYLMADASEKMFNYFCVRESSVALEPFGEESLDEHKVQLSFDSHAWQCTVCGYGATNAAYKLRNLSHSLLLKCHCAEDLESLRCQVLGYTSDQGTERKLADAALATEASFQALINLCDRINAGHEQLVDASAQSHYLFPNCLFMPGHLHLLFNALEEAVKSSSIWGSRFETCLRSLVAVLKNKGLRTRMEAMCFKDATDVHRHMFRNFRKQHLDWRWESLGELLDELVPLLPVLVKYWGKEKMVHGLDECPWVGDIEVLNVNNADEILKKPYLETILELLRVSCHHVNTWASWLEGCQCHEHIWTDGATRNSQLKRLWNECSLRKCMRKGCRGPEMATFALDMWLERLRTANSDKLTLLLLQLPEGPRGWLVDKLQFIRESIYETYSAKFEMWRHLPYMLLGLAADKDKAKQIGKSARAEWASCDQSKAHRVCHVFFRDAKIVSDLDKFCTSDRELSHYPRLHNLVTSYSLISLVERAIEGEHAKISNAFGGAGHKMLPPTVCARIRSPYLLDLLEGSKFYAWCTYQWSSHIFRNLLKSICPETKGWSRDRMLKNIYLYGIEQQFAPVSTHFSGVKRWESTNVAARQPVHIAPPAITTFNMQWLKSRLIPGRLLALSTDCVRFVDYCGYRKDEHASICPVNDVLSVIGSEELLTEPFNATQLTYFRVVNSLPNARVLQHTWHLGGKPTVVRVAVYNLVANRPDFSVLGARPEIQNLDLDHLCMDAFPTVLQSLWCFASMDLGTKLVLKDDVQQLLLRDTVTTMPPLLDVGGDANPAWAGALALRNDKAYKSIHASKVALETLAVQKAVHEAGVYVKLAGASDGVVGALENLGFLKVRDSVDGREVALTASSVEWHPFVRCSKPLLDATLPPMAKNICAFSKLDLLAILHREGFSPEGEKAVLGKSWKPGDLHYKLSAVLNGPKGYFACLVQRESLCVKGASYILHTAPAKYYAVLLTLENLESFYAVVDNENLTSKICDDHLKLADPGSIVDADASHSDPSEQLGVSGEDSENAMPVLMDERVAEKELLAPFVCPEVGGKGIPIVHFDNCSHHSGQLRGWVKCLWHPRCQKWRQLNVAGSKEALVSYLHAWCLQGAVLSKESHGDPTYVVAENLIADSARILYPDASA